MGDVFGDEDGVPRLRQPERPAGAVRDAPVKLGLVEIVRQYEQMGAGFIAKVVFFGCAKSATGYEGGAGVSGIIKWFIGRLMRRDFWAR